jgi:PAS domain S-box-containing protein
LEHQVILEHSPVGLLLTKDRKVLHCNPKCSELLGWPHGELVGQPGSVFYLSDEDYASIGQLVSPILSSGGMLEREVSMRRKDGSTIHCHVRAKAINAKNTSAGTIWIAEDIGERKLAEAELQDLLFKQQAILENASVGILFTHNGIIELNNPRSDQLFGWPEGTLVGQKASINHLNADAYGDFGRVVGKTLSAGELVDIEWRYRRKDGSQFWCRNLAKALIKPDGSHRTIWILKDITEKKPLKKPSATLTTSLSAASWRGPRSWPNPMPSY